MPTGHSSRAKPFWPSLLPGALELCALESWTACSTAPYLGAPPARAAQLNACLGSKNDAELAGLLSDYLRHHAEERRYEMPSVTLRALTALCNAEAPP